MIPGLHADHVDTSGAYNQKFQVVQDLLDKGLLKEIPEEFRDRESTSVTTSTVEVVGVVPVSTEPQWDMSRDHADHVDETGRYAQEYRARFGELSLANQELEGPSEQQNAGSSWKSFLQKIIAEEKSKLKV